MLELLDSRIPELSLTHSPNMSAPGDEKKTKSLHIARVAGVDNTSVIQMKVEHETESLATLNVGEARVFRVHMMQCMVLLYRRMI